MSMKPRDNLPFVSPRQSMTTYDQDFGAGTPRITPRIESRLAVSRLDVIEDRLISQEKSTQGLLERAYKIKEDIIDNLNITHGSWNEEKRQRELLQEHVRTITDIVKKLGTDINNLESQLRHKDGEMQGASSSMKNLELSHVAGLTDLRGRVGQCGTAITKLAADIRTTNDAVRLQNGESREHDSQLNSRIQSMDIRIAEMQKQLESTSSSHQTHMSHLKEDASSGLASLDQKSRLLIEEIRSGITTNKLQEENERRNLEERLRATIVNDNHKRDTRMDKHEKHMEESMKTMRDKIQLIHDEVRKNNDRTVQSIKNLEAHLDHVLDDKLRSQAEQIQRLKRECREGLSTLHDSLGHMKNVTDGKRQILEEQLKKEIAMIRKMVVLI